VRGVREKQFYAAVMVNLPLSRTKSDEAAKHPHTMYTLQQNRISFRRMFKFAGLLAFIWLVNSLLSPLWAQGNKLSDEKTRRSTSCYISKEELKVTVNLKETAPMTVRLFTLVGEELQSCCRDKIVTPGTHFYTYTLPHLKPGIYFCAVEVGSSQFVHKLCVP
jgi:hypothetical protein